MEQFPEDIQTMLWWLALDVVIVACAVVAIITTAKHAGRVVKGGTCLDQPWVQFVMEISPLILGPLIAIVPGLFDDFGMALQAVFGLIAGFNSEKVYTLIKRRLPTLMATKDARSGNG